MDIDLVRFCLLDTGQLFEQVVSEGREAQLRHPHRLLGAPGALHTVLLLVTGPIGNHPQHQSGGQLSRVRCGLQAALHRGLP